MDKTIDIYVNGSYLRKNSNVAGVQGEGNASVMHIIFDDSWAGTSKKITFWDSRGENPVKRILTNDLLVDITQSLLEYRVPIPPEPMAQEGDMVFVIDGYADGKRIRSVQDSLEVWAAMMKEEAGEPSDPTPTQAEQLQSAIEAILPAVQQESIKAQEAAESAEVSANAAAQSAESAKTSEANAMAAEQSVAANSDAASASAAAAKASETAAKASETNAAVSEAAAKSAQTAAAQSAESAKTSEANAMAAEQSVAANSDAANASAAAAKASEIAAKASETAAKESETNAAVSEAAAKSAQTAAEKAAEEASAIVGGDFITAAQAEEKISAAVTPVTEALNRVEDMLPEVFIAAYGTTTSAEIETAYQAGKAIYCNKDGYYYGFSIRSSVSRHVFVLTGPTYIKTLICSVDSWSETSSEYKPKTHASTHAIGGTDPITPESIGAKPAAERDVFIATYGTTTSAEIETAYQAGKAIYCLYNGNTIAPLTVRGSSINVTFTATPGNSGLMQYVCSSDDWYKQAYRFTPDTHASKHATGGTDPITPASIGAASTEDLSAKQDKHISAAASLAAANWSGNTLLASVPGVTENNTVIVTPTPECIADWQKYKIFCQSQFSGELKFACETVPGVDIYANVVILGV